MTRATPWTFAACLGAAVVAAPILVVLLAPLAGDPEGVWSHLRATVLPRYVVNSLLLAAGTSLLAAAIGVVCAWLVARCRFPGRDLLSWALLLPMAMPAYVLAFCWTDLFEYAGPVQQWLRESFAWGREDYWFPRVRSLPGAILVMASVLYPYVYLSCRAAFLEQGSAAFETARSLGWGAWRSFWRLAIPMARPALVAGTSLVAMETLADFGTVDYFGVDTFTTGIYRAWTGFGSYAAASRLAAYLAMGVFLVLTVERLSRGRRRYHRHGSRQQQPYRLALRGWRAGAASVACAAPIVIGFLLPASLLGYHVWGRREALDPGALAGPASFSLLLAGLSAVLAIMLALIIAYGHRLAPSRVLAGVHRISALGYAIPGSVAAVAVIVPLTWLDNRVLDPVLGTGLLLTGGIGALLFAYLVRFLAVALGTLASGLQVITPNMDRAARSLGAGTLAMLLRVHLPLLRSSLAVAALLVMVDVLKELPATILLRPLGRTTLAVLVFEQVSQESLRLAAAPALAIVLTGLVPVILLSRGIARVREASP